MNTTFKKSLFFIFVSCYFTLFAKERITSFKSTITVHEDASLTVHEKISVKCEGKKIKRGIFRVLPIKYNSTRIPLSILKVLRDKKETPFDTVKKDDDLYIYIRQKDVFLQKGRYTFEIIYKIERQLGFFKDYDELAWNVNGAFSFPIDTLITKIILPPNIPHEKIKTRAYTGYQGQRGKDYLSQVSPSHIATFQTTRQLNPHENMTIVVIWPKGYLHPLTIYQKIKYIFFDYPTILFILLSFLIILIFLISVKKYTEKKLNETIIPQFEPPGNMLPGEISYLLKKKYTIKGFTSDIINMAVLGILTIDIKKEGRRTTYILRKIKNFIPPLYKKTIQTLFLKTHAIALTRKNGHLIEETRRKLAQRIEVKYKKYIALQVKLICLGVSLSFILSFISIAFSPNSALNLFPLFIFIFSLFIFFKYLKSYTPQGFQLLNQIKGFKLFLNATEKERLKMTSAPDRTPEEYEKFLPYAIALGVEKNWTKQFESLFNKLKEKTKITMPHWYRGYHRLGRHFSYHSFRSNLKNARSLSGSFVRSMSSPGSSSSFTGGGFSGSGGGGGGGGGC